MNSSSYELSISSCTPFIHLNLFLPYSNRILCFVRVRSCYGINECKWIIHCWMVVTAVPRTTIPGRTCCCIMGSNVAASWHYFHVPQCWSVWDVYHPKHHVLENVLDEPGNFPKKISILQDFHIQPYLNLVSKQWLINLDNLTSAC